MARSEKQKEKLFRILEILMQRTDDEVGISMSELISVLDSEYGIHAERKSIYDDFLVLGELGFEVESIGGRPPKYTLCNRIFELAELKMLTDAVESSKFITAKKSREIISKLERFAGARHARELSRSVYVEDRVKTQNTATLYTIDTIHEAINENRIISFKYFDYNSRGEKVYRHGGATYTVSPIALIWSDENYYLVCIDEGEGVKKNFRVDKMTSLALTENPRSSNATEYRFNPAEYSKRIFGMYGGDEALVTLKCKEKLAGVVVDRFGGNARLLECDGGFRVTVKVMLSPNFFAWVLGFGADMVIESPGYVVDMLLSHLSEISKNYEKR